MNAEILTGCVFINRLCSCAPGMGCKTEYQARRRARNVRLRKTHMSINIDGAIWDASLEPYASIDDGPR